MIPASVRPPAVAGRFYPGDRAELAAAVDQYLHAEGQPQRAIACLAPHAGYMYSGHVAGAVYGAIELPRRFIILGPNHGGRGEPLATWAAGAWATPLGNAVIDAELAANLTDALPQLMQDPLAHRYEHSIEVQLPFLQRAAGEFAFVPICVGTAEFEVLMALGAAIAAVVEAADEPILLVCSSDMNHYEPDAATRAKDAHAIAPMLGLNAGALAEAVGRERISMCGFAPAVAMLAAGRILGAGAGKLVKYATSADVNHDLSYCVGYAGMTFA